jgi:parallel beta-helix repeat protein
MTCQKHAAKCSNGSSFAAIMQSVFRFKDPSDLYRQNQATLNPPDGPDRAQSIASYPASSATSYPGSVLRSSSPRALAELKAPVQRRLKRPLIFVALAFFAMSGAHAANWYVDGKSGRDYNSGSRYSPYKTVRKAWSRAQPGDTVHVLPTTTYGPIWLGGKSGYSGKYITLKGAGSSSNMTRVSGQWKNQGIMVEKGRSHIRIQNFNVTAPGHGSYPFSAILIPGNHHIEILNNYTHNSGCSGIATTHSDYITIRGNRVAYNSKDTHGRVYCSGISNYGNKAIDGNTGTKMIISHNAVWSNTNTKSSSCSWSCTNPDGSGIIVDDSRRTQTDWRAYRGRTLIQNNVLVNNGGRGIHIYRSDNINVFANTTYLNNRDPNEGSWRPGEITVNDSGGVNVYHNIFFTDGKYNNKYTGERVSVSVQNNRKGGAINVDHNLLYNWRNSGYLKTYKKNNSVPVNIGGNNRFANPRFKNPGSSLSWADFRPSWGSPAFNFYGPSWTKPSNDFRYKSRWNPFTAGAYQNGS